MINNIIISINDQECWQIVDSKMTSRVKLVLQSLQMEMFPGVFSIRVAVDMCQYTNIVKLFIGFKTNEFE